MRTWARWLNIRPLREGHVLCQGKDEGQTIAPSVVYKEGSQPSVVASASMPTPACSIRALATLLDDT
jgi:hypothetical protein